MEDKTPDHFIGIDGDPVTTEEAVTIVTQYADWRRSIIVNGELTKETVADFDKYEEPILEYLDENSDSSRYPITLISEHYKSQSIEDLKIDLYCEYVEGVCRDFLKSINHPCLKELDGDVELAVEKATQEHIDWLFDGNMFSVDQINSILAKVQVCAKNHTQAMEYIKSFVQDTHHGFDDDLVEQTSNSIYEFFVTGDIEM